MESFRIYAVQNDSESIRKIESWQNRESNPDQKIMTLLCYRYNILHSSENQVQYARYNKAGVGIEPTQNQGYEPCLETSILPAILMCSKRATYQAEDR